MSTSAAPDYTQLDYQLPANAYWHLMRTLRLTLPPPPTDDPADLLRRDHAAIAAVAGLAPGNDAEARLAAQFVAASEQWMDCLRLAQAPETTPEWSQKYRAQAARMMRDSNGAMRLLLQMQDARRKLEADSAASTRRDWTEHVTARLMAEALPEHPAKSADFAAPPSPQPTPLASPENVATTAPPAPAACGDSEPAPQPQPTREPAAEPEFDPVAAAEEYAAIYPERAALIRRLGRVPENVSFGPPEDDLVQALVSARTPALIALDHAFAEPAAA